ncbi:uncharacterized protein LOC132293433 [Cornus florida]|uniref:uncharacterized protein LOC132293433 n=1 Tax=Cornus florida TaxID=4283 RepID=UPI002899FFD5|nr:uncharacterized protein LOC132293433 [Cornus florida]
MANDYEVCLFEVMNRLWFHQIILFPEPTVLIPKTLKTSKPTSESLPHPSITEDHEMLSPIPSSATPLQEDDSNNEDDTERLNLMISKSRSHSSSPLNKKSSKCLSNYSGYSTSLQKTMSCKSLWELELEEVKGFRDLGFIFTKENLTPRMMSVLPGLQRLGLGGFAPKDDETEKEEEEEEEEEMRGLMMRPYLSEAWLIKRPDSTLLNLRIPRVSAAADMKKHIRNWAKTVASVIHHVS